MFRSIRLLALLSLPLLALGCGRSAPLTDKDLLTVRLLPQDPEMYLEQIIQLAIEARYADGSVEDVTNHPALKLRLNDEGVIKLVAGGKLLAQHAGQVRLMAAFDGKEDTTDISVRYALLEGIHLEPEQAQLDSGHSQQLTLYGDMSDGGQMDLTLAAMGTRYSSDVPAVAEVSGDGLVFAMRQGTARMEAVHGQFTSISTILVDGGSKEITALEMLPPELGLAVGESMSLQVIATFADGSTSNLTDDPEVVYSSDDHFIASVNGNGLVQALIPGAVDINAVYRTHTASTHVVVTDKLELTGIELSPQTAQLSPGAELNLLAEAIYLDGSRVTITPLADYQSSDTAVAQVNGAGRVTANSPGQTTVQASFEGYSDSSQILVSHRQLIGLTIEGGDFVLPLSGEKQLVVMGQYDDGSQENISAAAWGTTYQVSAPAVISVDADGLVRAAGAGWSHLTVQNSGLQDRAEVTVTGTELTGLRLLPQNLTLVVNQIQQLSVLAQYSDGSEQDKTAQATFRSTDGTVVTVDPSGVALAEGAGQARIWAEFGGLEANTQVDVLPAQMMDLWLEPESLSLDPGQQYQLTVWAAYSDGSQAQVTDQAQYLSSNQQVAGVSASGLVVANELGQALVSATIDAFSDTCSVSVIHNDLIDFWVEPDQLSLQPGGQVQLLAWARYADGRLEDVTAECQFSSDNSDVAAVDGVGLVSAGQPGQTTISASFSGRDDFCQVTVSSQPDLISLDLQPDSADLAVGEILTLSVTAGYSDGSFVDVTSLAGYGSSDPTVASVVSPGRVDALSGGDTTISASFGGLSDNSAIHVDEPIVLTGLSIAPSSASLVAGSILDLLVLAHYSDGSSQQVTDATNFFATHPLILQVSATGRVTALSEGVGRITASYGGFVAEIWITVLPPILVDLELLPPTAQLNPSQTLDLEVWAHYSNNTSQDVTSQADYSSVDPNVASVSGFGIITAQGSGQTAITATYQGLSDDCLVTVSGLELQSIELSPRDIILPSDGLQQFSVTGHYSDSSQADLSSQASGTTYSLSQSGIVAVSPNGLVNALAQGGQVTLTARNNGFEDSTLITVEDNPAPQLLALVPQEILAGVPFNPLEAQGQNFISNSLIRVDGLEQDTTFNSTTSLSTVLDGTFTMQSGVYQVTVYNPHPGGGESNSLPLWVVGQPLVTTVSPTSGLQGQAVRVAFYGQGLLGCTVSTENSGIVVSNISYSEDGLSLFATFTVASDAPLGLTRVHLSNAAGSDTTFFQVNPDSGLSDCIVSAGDTVYWSGTVECANVSIATGATVIGDGFEPLQITATGQVNIRGRIIVSGINGEDGLRNPADGGDAGPGGGGGGGGGDGDLDGFPLSQGGAGSPYGLPGGAPIGQGTSGGDGGGTGAGRGAANGCGPGGGGGAFGGDGGDGGGDAGPGSGGAGGQANSEGSEQNGGTGGGGGSTCGPNSGGGGGGGGGVLIIASTGGAISIEGALSADGGAGGYGYDGTGGGGGGSGGRITITSAGGPIVLEDTISAMGGDGARADAGDGGGGGGGGRIIIDAGGGGVDDSLGFYQYQGGSGGVPRLDGFSGLDGGQGLIVVHQ